MQPNVKQHYCYRPRVDYFWITSHSKVFYSSYRGAIWRRSICHLYITAQFFLISQIVKLGSEHSVPKADRVKGLTQWPNSGSIAVLGLELPTFLSVTQNLNHWPPTALFLNALYCCVYHLLFICKPAIFNTTSRCSSLSLKGHTYHSLFCSFSLTNIPTSPFSTPSSLLFTSQLTSSQVQRQQH